MDPQTIVLSSPRLQASIQVPGSIYASSRFDWSSQVVSLLLDGTHEFLTREEADGSLPDRRGHGLATEFGIRTPIGYGDCPLGGYFPKIGAGWLPRKTLDAYNFYPHEPDMDSLDWELDFDGHSARFSTTAGKRRGYGWNLSRYWEVNDCTLVNTVILENTGSLPLQTDEYAHNFIQLAKQGPGPDWSLETSFALQDAPGAWGGWDCIQYQAGSTGLGFNSKAREQFGSGLLASLQRSPLLGSCPWWKLKDSSSGLWIQEQLSVPAKSFELWGAPHVFSPELFVLVNLAPGESASWERSYQLGLDV